MASDLRSYLSSSRKRLPSRRTAEEAAQLLEQIHVARGGATFSLYFGDMYGQSLFAVSLYPEPPSALVVSGRKVPVALLRAFITANVVLLADPRLCIGTWYQEEEDLTFVDIVAVVTERDEAVALGRRYNQIAVYDLNAGREIETGGSGEWTAGDVAPKRRLPPMERHRSGR